MIAFEGIPAIYLNSMFGNSNDESKYIITGNNRDVNRYKWSEKNILNLLKDKKSKESIIYNLINKLLKIRRKQKAFHPNALRSQIYLGNEIFCFKRTSLDKEQIIISISNLTSKIIIPKLNKKYLKWKNLIDPQIYKKNKGFLILKPFETIWLSNI